jgi:hypothetical protein
MSNTAKPKRWPSEGKGSDSPAAPNVVPIRGDGGPDPLDGFAPESGSTPAAPKVAGAKSAISRTKSLIAGAAFIAIALAAAGVFYVRGRVASARPASATVATGRAILNSRPEGANVIVDGQARGVTPLELDLAAGSHDVIFKSDASERRIALKIESGMRVAENVDMPAAAPSSGALEIVSDPAGARVTLDGSAAGTTPLTLRNVTAARHVIAVSQGSNVVNRTVEVTAGSTASVFVSLAAQSSGGGGGAGTFAVESPLELRIIENGQLLGVANAAPIVLSAGRHQFELVNDALDLRLNRTVTVDAGKSTRLNVTVPNGTLSINASPWAEVFVDNRSVGITPLGSVSVPIGSHEVVWRHPQLGEKRRTVVVGAQTPTRISMDLTK